MKSHVAVLAQAIHTGEIRVQTLELIKTVKLETNFGANEMLKPHQK